MLPILITVLVTAPILALGTWLYLRRRTLSPRVRILLASLVFCFVLFAGPVVYFLWQREGVAREFLTTGRAAGLRFLNQFVLLWFMAVIGIGVQLLRLCRRKGEL